MSNSQPMLSVLCITYNHEKYINQTIDSFLMQETTFDFEIVIGEDCSTDRTREICLEYKAKYPDKINLLLPEKNQGLMGNFIATLEACKGKYIAVCGGDDYWTDPLKLQKQVDFLEANPDYSMCFHNTLVVYENNSKESLLKNHEKYDRDYSAKELFQVQLPFQASSVVFRMTMLHFPKNYREYAVEDIGLFLSLSESGKVRGLSDMMSVYRRHENCFSSNYNIEYNLKILKMWDLIDLDFKNRYRKITNLRRASTTMNISRQCIGNNICYGLKYALLTYYYNPAFLYRKKIHKIVLKLFFPKLDICV